MLINYFEEGPTINSVYVAEELRRLRQEIARKRRGKVDSRRSALVG